MLESFFRIGLKKLETTGEGGDGQETRRQHLFDCGYLHIGGRRAPFFIALSAIATGRRTQPGRTRSVMMIRDGCPRLVRTAKGWEVAHRAMPRLSVQKFVGGLVLRHGILRGLGRSG
jgi:hypothetical protein